MVEWLTALEPQMQVAFISAAVSIAVALIVAFLNPFGQRQLEQLKSSLKRPESAEEAWQSYAYDARKTLYVKLEPLLFQNYEMMEGAYYRIASLVRTSRQGCLDSSHSWLSSPGYYFMSTIYYLFAPAAVFQLMRNAVTFVDLRLDPQIRIKLYLAKMYVWSFSDDFVFAELAPELPYAPESADPMMNEQRYYKQGLYAGDMESFCDNLLVEDGDRQRLITYGEFANRASSPEMNLWSTPVGRMFRNFGFSRRPVQARMLLTQALISRLILYSFVRSTTVNSLEAALRKFCATENAANDLRWWPNGSVEPFRLASSYIEQRLRWVLPDYHDIPD